MTYDTTTPLIALALSFPLAGWVWFMCDPESLSAVFAAFARRPYSQVEPEDWKREPVREMTDDEMRLAVRRTFDSTARIDSVASAMSYLQAIPKEYWPPQSEIDAALEAEGIEREVERSKDNEKPYRGRWKSKYRREGDDAGDVVDSSRYTPPKMNTNPDLEINEKS